MKGLEQVYKQHHAGRGEDFAILEAVRGSFLRKHVGVGQTVLDIGCRDGQLTSAYLEGNTVTGADVDKNALDRAAKKLGIDTVHCDLNEKWPFPSASYSAVVTCEFLEHIYFPDQVLKKIADVLKPGGKVVGTIPHAYSIQSRVKFLLGRKTGTPLQDPTHINQFLHQELRTLLEAEFTDVHIEGHVPKRYRLLSKLFPLAFADVLMFKGIKN